MAKNASVEINLKVLLASIYCYVCHKKYVGQNKCCYNSTVESPVDEWYRRWISEPGGGTWVFFGWVYMCRPGLQIGTPF